MLYIKAFFFLLEKQLLSIDRRTSLHVGHRPARSHRSCALYPAGPPSFYPFPRLLCPSLAIVGSQLLQKVQASSTTESFTTKFLPPK